MTLETIAAKKGIEISAKALKVIGFVLLVGAVCSLAWCTADRFATLRTENQGLKAYRTTVERREELGATATTAHEVAKTQETAQGQQQAEVVVIHDRATQEAAREDPSSADFLHSRIPDRLRRADREARESREERDRRR